jgi:hypothetical protein
MLPHPDLVPWVSAIYFMVTMKQQQNQTFPHRYFSVVPLILIKK